MMMLRMVTEHSCAIVQLASVMLLTLVSTVAAAASLATPHCTILVLYRLSTVTECPLELRISRLNFHANRRWWAFVLQMGTFRGAFASHDFEGGGS